MRLAVNQIALARVYNYSACMVVTIKLPDVIAHPEKRILEALALDGYRTGDLSRGQVSELLGLSFSATERFLHDHDVSIWADRG